MWGWRLIRGRSFRPFSQPQLWQGRSAGAWLFLAALLVTGCGSGASQDESGAGGEGAKLSSVEVTVTPVGRREMIRFASITGTIAPAPNRDARVSSLVPGGVVELRVAEGDRVAAGEVLARIDDRPLRDQLRQAEAAQASARASLANAQAARKRNEYLFTRGIAAQRDEDDSRTAEAVAEAALHQAEAALALARLQVSRAEVRSPISGFVVKRFVSVGEQVDGTANQPVVEVAGLDPVEWLGNVPAPYLAALRVHQTVILKTEGNREKTYTGRIVAISPAVDPATNTGLLRLRLTNPQGELKLGVFLLAQVPLESHPNALVVPREAIYRDQAGQPHVYRVENGVAKQVSVEAGIESEDLVEIVSGVKEGERIVVTGGYGLPDGTPVKVQEQVRR